MPDYFEETVELDTALIDWLTVTSFEPLFYDVQKKLIKLAKGKVSDGHKRLQYLGTMAYDQRGSIFCGDAEQKGAAHYMTQISGELCNDTDLLIPVAQGIREYWLACRRIDLQMTITEPDSWVQWALFNRSKKKRRSVGWVESTNQDGELLQTVYIGARTSGKFLRVYEKWIGRTRCLRCEYELKGNTAQSFSRMVFDGTSTVAQLLKLLIQQTSDEELSSVFLPKLEHVTASEKPKILTNEPKTEKWLRETVFPSWLNYINTHTANPEIIKLYGDAIDRVRDNKNEN